MSESIIIKSLGRRDYVNVWNHMREFTDKRTENTKDEIWLVEHPPVFTQGQAGKKEHVLNPGDIPIIETDRGGQVTYHGPGQILAYLMMDIQRLKLSTRDFVCKIEQAMINCLANFSIKAKGNREAPGVYVNDAKIGSIGLRIRRGRSYHGLALNVDMDLEPFSRINPCGFADLRITQVSELNPNVSVDCIKEALTNELKKIVV